MATHNIGGEITYKVINAATNEYEITLTTYTEPSSQADRDSLAMEIRVCGNTTLLFSKVVLRSQKNHITNLIQKNDYVLTSYSFPGQGCYSIGMLDPNRIHNVQNMMSSVNVPFYIESHLIITSSATDLNNSAQFNTIPLFFAAVNDTFDISAAAFDPDGDCLSYRLVPPRGDLTSSVPGYYYPDQSPGIQNKFTIDSISGNIKGYFEVSGIYSYAVMVVEWENGIPKGSVTRDVLIFVSDNSPFKQQFDGITNWQSNSQGIYEYTILPGDTLNLNLIFEDNDNLTNQTLSAYGEILNIPNPASFITISTGIDQISGNFNWIPTVADAQSVPYIVTFRGATALSLTSQPAKDVTLLIYTSTVKEDCYQVAWTNIADKKKRDFHIYPNPADDYVILEMPERTGAAFALYDLMGRKVFLKEYISSGKISLEGLPPGIYFYEITEGMGALATGKIIIQ